MSAASGQQEPMHPGKRILHLPNTLARREQLTTSRAHPNRCRIYCSIGAKSIAVGHAEKGNGFAETLLHGAELSSMRVGSLL